MSTPKQKIPTLLQSITPIAVLLILIMINVLYTKGDTLGGSNQLSLLLSAFVAGIIAMYNKISWKHISDKITETFSSAVPAILILLMVGVLSGSWMTAGIIPTMIYYGLDILKPDYFLVATVIITAFISIATGSSWSTIATIGVALIGIGNALEFNPAWTAGAIISGAYFGDKISPLSDTTNLASTVAKVDLFKHIKFMMRTTVPSIIITLIIFIGITFLTNDNKINDVSRVTEFQQIIGSTFNVNLALLLIPAIVIFLIIKKTPAIPVLMIGSLLAIVVAPLMQWEYLTSLNGNESLTWSSTYDILTRAMYGRITPNSSSLVVNDLLSTGGMGGMTNTVWLIITAMIFGGIMEAGHFLERITKTILSKVTKRSSMVGATTSSCILFNLTTSDQYISIVIPGKMFVKAYSEKEYNPLLLSRTLEDSATATSVLIPWNTCGATQATILGVATLTYLPFAFFCWLSPLMTMLFAYMGWFQDEKRDNITELEAKKNV